MMPVFELMDSKYDDYTKSELLVYEKIKKNMTDFVRMTATDFASKYEISQASMTRFAQKLGFSGYNDLKYEMSRNTFRGKVENETVFDHYINSIKKIEKYFQTIDMSQLIEMITTANHILITGIQRNKVPSMMMDYNFKEFGYYSQMIEYDNLSRIDSFTSNKDLLFIFSYGGSESTYKTMLETFEQSENSPRICLITSNPNSKLIDKAYHAIVLEDTDHLVPDPQVVFTLFVGFFFTFIPKNPYKNK